MKTLQVREIADLVKGQIIGDAGAEFTGVSKIDHSIPGSLTFLSNPKYESYLETTRAKVILLAPDRLPDDTKDHIFITVEDPYLAFCKVLNVHFSPSSNLNGIHQAAVIAPGATIGNDVYIGANSVIESGAVIADGVKIYPNCFIGPNCTIGAGSILYSNVSVYYDTQIGAEVIIHSGTVIGSDGFGHAPQKDGTYVKIPQLGNVIIEDRVEIGANCAIDRATLGSTIIREGSKLDNLIQIAHNVEIGAHTVIAGQTGISGSTSLGAHCVIAGQVGFAGHLKIADGTKVGAQSGLNKSIDEPNQRLFGSPAVPLNEALRTHVIIRTLPEMNKRIDDLEKRLNAMTDE
ncbi:MAG: UDP-3-O-(3-hydroxymyristoyl)glucosamine N-acyltransferase [Flavobacteriales bacterium]|nr:UDP-3-O-(3-hydroxymyristoyl)glucosamine N-acyltransferase [Flavobacteriales bacterium]